MKTKVWAHRGASAYAPENTLEAFALADRMGADGIELDVQLSRDGEVVVVHDETIDRVSSGTGFVKDSTLAELKAMHFSRLHPEYAGAVIPTLREVYELLRDSRMTVNVELKNSIIPYPGLIEKTLKITADCGMKDRVIYSSFFHPGLLEVKRLQPDAETGMLYSDGLYHAAEYAKDKLHVDALHPALYHMQDPALLKEAAEKGLAIHVWTVNEAADMERLIRDGIDAIITNKPDLCRKCAEQS